MSATAPAPHTAAALPSPGAARLAISLLFFVNGLGFASWVTRIPAVRGALGLDEAQLGWALFAMAGGALLSFPLAGRACARHGARRTTLVIGALYCVMLTLPGQATSLPLLALALALFGAANGAMDVAMNAHAVEVEVHVGKPIMSSLHGVWSAGGLVGAAAGGLAAGQGLSPALHLAIVAVVLAGVVVAVRRHLPPSTPHDGPAGPKFAWPSAAMLGLGVVIFCAFLVEGGMADWSAVYLQDGLGTSAAVATVGYSVFSLTMMVMRFLGDTVVARWGAVPLLRWSNAAAALAFAAALWTGHRGLTLAAFALTGLAIATVAPLVFGAAARRSTSSAGQGIAAMATMGYSGFLLGPAIIGMVAHASSLRLALALLVLLVAAISVMAHALREPHSA